MTRWCVNAPTPILLLLFAQIAFAREDMIPGSRYTSAQGAAVGDAALSFGDDIPSGLFYNPADLGKIRKFTAQPLNLSIYGNSGLISHFTTSSYEIVSLSSYSSTMQASPGTRFGAGWSLVPNLGFPGVSFGILTQSEFAGRAASDGSITYQTVSQIIPAVGVGFRFFNGVVRFGYSFQFVSEAVGTATAASGTTMSYTTGLSQGSALSHNFGLSLVAPIRSLPELDLVARNVGNATYSSMSLYSFTSSSVGVPTTENMSFDASLSARFRLGEGANSHWAVEYRDALNSVGYANPMEHFCAGLEASIKDRFFLRGGYRGGYPSAGIAFKKKGTDLSLTYYTEEIGTSFQDQGDSRLMLQYITTVY